MVTGLIAARLLGALLISALLTTTAWTVPLEEAGMVEVVTLDSSIMLDTRYGHRQ